VILTEFAEEDEPGGALTARSHGSDTARDSLTERSDSFMTARRGSPHSPGDDAGDHGAAKLSRTARLVEKLNAPSPPWPADYSLFLFGPQNAIRHACKAAVARPEWGRVVIALIIASSVTLALDSPRLDPTSNLAYALKCLDVLFTLLFLGEMLAKVIAVGFAFTKDAYIKSPWNQLDFVIVCISLLVLLADAVPQARPKKPNVGRTFATPCSL
jgi:hypothetical protein